MPYINIRVMENVLSDAQKREIADQVTEAIVSVVGEPVRNVTWVVVDDIGSGALSIGGTPITTDAVREMLALVGV